MSERIIKYGLSERIGSLEGKTAVVVDDGIATGYTALAGIEYLKLFAPFEIWLVTPTCAKDTLRLLEENTDKIICLETPDDFYAVGQSYLEFPQISDEEVSNLLKSYKIGKK